VFKARRLCVSLNSRLESNKEEEKLWVQGEELREASFEFWCLGFGVSGDGPNFDALRAD
jgi:hypothetical protein